MTCQISDRLTLTPLSCLRGRMRMPGDKSISHRAVILASIAQGKSCISGLQKGKDCLATIRCMQNLGVQFRDDGKHLFVEGRGLRGLSEPGDILDCQNSGTTLRVLSGILCAQNFYSVVTGDASLRKRPMERIITPLCKMGANIWSRKGWLAPLSIRGTRLQGIDYSLPVASAQVKSALLLAGLYAEDVTKVQEPYASRDHTERMLSYMGVKISVENLQVLVEGGQQVEARDFLIPGDFSAAAFFMGGAAILEGSRIKIEQVGVNPTRCGFLEVLVRMGAKITLSNRTELCNEAVADIEVEGGNKLAGVQVSKQYISRLIDEIPILVVVACFAEGETLIEGASELRVKETDRIKALCMELTKMGARIEEREDGMFIHGTGKLTGAEVDSWGDHRIAMALAIAGICAEGTTILHNARCIDISFPDFFEKLKGWMV